MPSTRHTLSHLLLGQKGGEHRAQIIELLRERPYNINQMAELLDVNYRTVKHHVDVLIDSGLVGPQAPHGYGEVFFLTPMMEESLPLFESIIKKVRDLTSSPNFFRSVIEGTSDAVIVIDGSGEVLSWNVGAERLFGHAAHDVIGESISVFLEGTFLEGVIRRALAGEKVYAHEARGRHKDGSELDLAVTLDVLEDVQGDVAAYTILARDISERMRLRRKREHLASFPVLNPLPVIELDRSGKVTFSNTATASTVEGLGLGNDVTALLPPDLPDILALLDGKGPRTLDREVRVKDAAFRLSVHTLPEFKVARIYAMDVTELRKREREVLMANERLAHLLSSSPAVIYTSKTSGDYAATFISDNVVQMTGYTPKDFLDDPSFWTERIHPNDLDRVIAGARTALETGSHAYDYRFRRADGTYIWVYDAVRVVRDGEGRPLEFVGYWADITDRKFYEDRLRISEKRRRLAMSAAGMGTFIWNIRTNKVEFGKELEAIYGLPPGGLGDSFEAWRGMIHPEEVEDVMANVARNRDNPHPRSMEFRVVWSDGTVHWVRSWGETLMGEDGRPEFIVGANMDVTEHKRADQALAESEERFRYLFETITQGVVLQDADGLIVAANPEAMRLLGLSLDQLQGRTSMDPRWRSVREDGTDFPGDEHPSMVALRTGETVKDVVMGIFNPRENDYVWLSIDAIPRYGKGEPRPVGAFTTFKRVPQHRSAGKGRRGKGGPGRARPPKGRADGT